MTEMQHQRSPDPETKEQANIKHPKSHTYDSHQCFIELLLIPGSRSFSACLCADGLPALFQLVCWLATDATRLATAVQTTPGFHVFRAAGGVRGVVKCVISSHTTALHVVLIDWYQNRCSCLSRRAKIPGLAELVNLMLCGDQSGQGQAWKKICFTVLGCGNPVHTF